MGRWTGIGIVLITGVVLTLGMVLRQPSRQADPNPLLVQTTPLSQNPIASPVEPKQPEVALAQSSRSVALRPAPLVASPAAPAPITEPKPAASSPATIASPATTPVETPQASVPPPVAIPSPSPIIVDSPVPTPAPPPPTQFVPAKKPSTVTLNKDTVIGIRLDDAISSSTATAGQKISATVSRNVVVDGVTAIPAGTRLEGTVEQVGRPKPTAPRGKLVIRFTSLVRPDYTRVAISTEMISREASDPNAPNNAFDTNGLGSILSNRAAPLRSTGPTTTGTPVPAGPKALDIQLSAGAVMTVHLTAPLTIFVDRNPQ